MLAGQEVKDGGSVSLTVTVNEQGVPVSGVQVTVVVPTGKGEPEAGLQMTIPHEPLDVGANVTTALHWPGSFEVVMGPGQVSVQGTTAGAFWKRATNISTSLIIDVLIWPPTSILSSDCKAPAFGMTALSVIPFWPR
jgi:hypothetical protein